MNEELKTKTVTFNPHPYLDRMLLIYPDMTDEQQEGFIGILVTAFGIMEIDVDPILAEEDDIEFMERITELSLKVIDFSMTTSIHIEDVTNHRIH